MWGLFLPMALKKFRGPERFLRCPMVDCAFVRELYFLFRGLGVFWCGILSRSDDYFCMGSDWWGLFSSDHGRQAHWRVFGL